MKLIGMELRVGIGGGYGVLEAKLVPVEIVIPTMPYYGGGNPEAEVTFHCDAGDVTTPRIQLPHSQSYSPSAKQFQSASEMNDWLRQYLESVRL